MTGLIANQRQDRPKPVSLMALSKKARNGNDNVLFERSGGVEIKTEDEPSIEAIKNEIYHQLFQSGAFAEKTADGITFRQGFLGSMARKYIAGISSGRITINKSDKDILLSYQLYLKNYFIGSILVVLWLSGMRWFMEGKFSAIISLSLWTALIAAIHIISPFEFKSFLRQCVKASSTKR